MTEHKITVLGGTSVRLPTAGKYCEKDIVISATGGDHEQYKGSYTVTPSVTEQKMATKNKVMLDDVTVEAIPYAEVTNTSNGKTVTIG